MNRIFSVERRNGQLASLWHQYSGMRMVLHSVIEAFLTDKIKKKRPHLKKSKVLLRQDNTPVQKSIKTTAKLYELDYILLPHLFADLKKMLFGMKFSTNEEVIAETEAHFEAKEKLSYTNVESQLIKV
jgi:hypothetical protein